MRKKYGFGLLGCLAFSAAVTPVAGQYTVTASPDVVLPGGVVQVSWTAIGATSASDWIGLYAVGADNVDYQTFVYTEGFTSGVFEFAAPAGVSTIEFRYLLNGGYTDVAISNPVEVSCAGANGDGPDVLILSGGDLATDCAIQRTLQQRGFHVTPGPTIPTWDGTQADLTTFDAVVLPHNFNWRSRMLDEGVAALAGFVMDGGGLVTGEWALWGAFTRSQTDLLEVAPVEDFCGFNDVATTTYSQATVDPEIHDGMPASFEIALRSVDGSESCFGARPEATVFYTSSNGGGRADAAGLVGWDFGQGRVASFSTLMTDTELADEDYARLLGNTVEWVIVGEGSGGDDGTTDGDEDGDGVSDEDDFCIGTTAGAEVDVLGCSDEDLGLGGDDDLDGDDDDGIVDDDVTDGDEDGDGVSDEDDFCFGTTDGADVDIDGCSDEDLADDGGVVVEVTGCGAIGMIPLLFMTIGLLPLRRRS